MAAPAIRRVTLAALTACLCAGAPLAAAQPADPKSVLAERIREAQSQGGPYAQELIDPLKTLSLLYLEDGEPALADAVIEQALQVMRANYGLRSLEQAPLIRQRIANEESRGNFAAAWELEQDLLTIAKANPDDLRAVPVFREVGDKRLAMLARYHAGEFPPGVVLGCYYAWRPPPGVAAAPDPTGCGSGSRNRAIGAILSDAQRNYASAIEVLLRHGLYSSGELMQLERDLLRSSYAYSGRYRTGRQSISRLISYSVANDAPLAERARVLLELADWDLLFERRGLALELYGSVYEYLQQQRLPQAAIDELFAPAAPVALPTFVPNAFAGTGAERSRGYVDVAFEITRFGASRRVDVVAASDTASRADKQRLVMLVQTTRFRPRTTDGSFDRASPVVVRYHLPQPSAARSAAN